MDFGGLGVQPRADGASFVGNWTNSVREGREKCWNLSLVERLGSHMGIHIHLHHDDDRESRSYAIKCTRNFKCVSIISPENESFSAVSETEQSCRRHITNFLWTVFDSESMIQSATDTLSVSSVCPMPSLLWVTTPFSWLSSSSSSSSSLGTCAVIITEIHWDFRVRQSWWPTLKSRSISLHTHLIF